MKTIQALSNILSMVMGEKSLNYWALLIGIIASCTTEIFGGYDMPLKTLVILAVIDIITGLLKAFSTGTLSSKVNTKGLAKKFCMFLIVACSVQLETLYNVPLHEGAVSFYIFNEILSILENVDKMVDLPPQIMEFVNKIRNNNISETNRKEQQKKEEETKEDISDSDDSIKG